MEKKNSPIYMLIVSMRNWGTEKLFSQSNLFHNKIFIKQYWVSKSLVHFFIVETLNNISAILSIMYLLNCKIYNMGLSHT